MLAILVILAILMILAILEFLVILWYLQVSLHNCQLVLAADRKRPAYRNA